MRDINTVKASILRSLTSHYHNRVAYPDSKTMGKQSAAPAPTPSQPASAPSEASQAKTAAEIKKKDAG